MITYEYVYKRLSNLDIEPSMGPDGFHPKLLSSCQAVAYPIYLIYKKSLQCGQLSAQYKESLVFPLFKKGSRYSPLNYRPKNLTSACCKTLEREIAAQLYDHID